MQTILDSPSAGCDRIATIPLVGAALSRVLAAVDSPQARAEWLRSTEGRSVAALVKLYSGNAIAGIHDRTDGDLAALPLDSIRVATVGAIADRTRYRAAAEWVRERLAGGEVLDVQAALEWAAERNDWPAVMAIAATVRPERPAGEAARRAPRSGRTALREATADMADATNCAARRERYAAERPATDASDPRGEPVSDYALVAKWIEAEPDPFALLAELGRDPAMFGELDARAARYVAFHCVCVSGMLKDLAAKLRHDAAPSLRIVAPPADSPAERRAPEPGPIDPNSSGRKR